MKNIAVIIPIHNCLAYTKQGLRLLSISVRRYHALKGHAYKINIIVVDDGSTDGSAAWIQRNYPDVHIVSGNGHLWWSGAVTAGTRYALDKLATDYILLWNNDIKPEAAYFIRLEKILRENDPMAIIGSKIYYMNPPDKIFSMGCRFNPRTGERIWIGKDCLDSDSFQAPYEVDQLNGMGTILPKIVFQKIGFWDAKRFPQYYGDTDFTYRAKKAGFKINTHPDLKIWNDIANTGILHNNSMRLFLQSLINTKSYFNIRKDLLFYHRHAESFRAYKALLPKYADYFYSFFGPLLNSLIRD